MTRVMDLWDGSGGNKEAGRRRSLRGKGCSSARGRETATATCGGLIRGGVARSTGGPERFLSRNPRR